MLDPSFYCLFAMHVSGETNYYHGKPGVVVIVPCHDQDCKHDLFWLDFATLALFASHEGSAATYAHICARSFETAFEHSFGAIGLQPPERNLHSEKTSGATIRMTL